MQALEARFGRLAAIDALRAGADVVRRAISGEPEAIDADRMAARIEAAAMAHLDRTFQSSLRSVINATGVVLHTNLGRAPLAASAIEKLSDVARAYSTLEYDLVTGERGRRDVHAEGLLCRLTGAEAAIVVNNNAAAALIVLAALAAGREVIVSRGELVEIGGGFRIPDVLTQSGASLREVGTTNKTRVSDYAAAISNRTALLLRVHPSNFRIEGFTERPALGELVALGRRFSVPVAEDLGSGHLGGATGHPLESAEPSVEASIAAGVDVCCFSGDKLLGGPQAGIIVGRTSAIEPIRHHPLMRALRTDKLTYAALEGTLVEYASGRAPLTIPVQRMLTIPAAELRARAESFAAAVDALGGGWQAVLAQGRSAVGGGSAPGVTLPTWLVAIEKNGQTADALERALRAASPPVIARIEHERVVFDFRTVAPDDDRTLTMLLQKL